MSQPGQAGQRAQEMACKCVFPLGGEALPTLTPFFAVFPTGMKLLAL